MFYNDGNYLGYSELIAKFNPLLSRHLNGYGNKSQINVSYLSYAICNELIPIMNKYVLQIIINEVTTAKYFSLLVNYISGTYN